MVFVTLESGKYDCFIVSPVIPWLPLHHVHDNINNRHEIENIPTCVTFTLDCR